MRCIGHNLSLLVLILYGVAAGPSPCFGQKVDMVNFEIKHVSKREAEKFKSYFFASKKILEQYFAATKFTDLFPGVLYVHVFEYRPPISEALLPAWEGHRGHLKFPAVRVNDGTAAILHEQAHVHAPNQVRFLAEGYPTYLEELIGNIAAHPMHGKVIVERMKILHAKYPSAFANVKLTMFDGVSTQRNFRLEDHVGLENAIPDPASGPSDRPAYCYLVSASFVKYLMNAYGQDKFQALYNLTPLTPGTATASDPARYQKIYGKLLPELEAEWRNWFAIQSAKSHRG